MKVPRMEFFNFDDVGNDIGSAGPAFYQAASIICDIKAGNYTAPELFIPLNELKVLYYDIGEAELDFQANIDYNKDVEGIKTSRKCLQSIKNNKPLLKTMIEEIDFKVNPLIHGLLGAKLSGE